MATWSNTVIDLIPLGVTGSLQRSIPLQMSQFAVLGKRLLARVRENVLEPYHDGPVGFLEALDALVPSDLAAGDRDNRLLRALELVGTPVSRPRASSLDADTA